MLADLAELGDNRAAILLTDGRFFGPTDVMKKMRPSQCHENVIRLVKKNPKLMPWTGFALSGDGILEVSLVGDRQTRESNGNHRTEDSLLRSPREGRWCHQASESSVI